MTMLFPQELARLQYLIRFFVFVAVLLVIFLPFKDNNGHFNIIIWGVGTTVYLLRLPCLDVPRLRNAGWSPYLILLELVPVVNFVFQCALFFIPPKAKRY
jgi:uncharacterized membrane protein YhaH (DUF805 family)